MCSGQCVVGSGQCVVCSVYVCETERERECVQGWTGGKKWPGSYCQTGPLNTRRAAHSVHGALPTQYTARCPFNASHVSTSQWPTWKNTHTLNITLDDYKEITSYMFFL